MRSWANRRLVVLLGSLGIGLVSGGLLLFNTSALDWQLKYKWRYWMDFVAATRIYLDHRLGEAATADADPERTAWAKRLVESRAVQAHIERWQWWRVIGLKPFIDVRETLPPVPVSEDPGRASLLALGFRWVGGLSPFLLVFLGAFCAIPVLFWIAWELLDAGFPWGGTLFPILVVSLPYVVQNLALPYSAVAFYLIAVLGLLPLSTYAVAGRGRSVAFALLRVALAGLLFGVCASCRSDVVGLAPGFGLAIAIGSCRLLARRGQRLLFSLAALALFLLPYAVLRPVGHHNLWQSMWEGVGDFDRTKGHRWSDMAAGSALRAAGVRYDLTWFGLLVVTEEGEQFFKAAVVKDVSSDPAWYAGILLQRVFAILTLHRPLHFAPLFPPGTSPTEAPDHLSFQGMVVPIPWPLLLLPTLCLLVLRFPGSSGPGVSKALAIVGCVAAGAFWVPFLISTLAAAEMQAFALVYLVGLCLALDLAVSRGRPKEPGHPLTDPAAGTIVSSHAAT